MLPPVNVKKICERITKLISLKFIINKNNTLIYTTLNLKKLCYFYYFDFFFFAENKNAIVFGKAKLIITHTINQATKHFELNEIGLGSYAY